MIDDDTIPVSEARSLLDGLRSNQHDKQESANQSTSAQSRKYNQGAAYAYCISANTLESLIEEHTDD